MPLKTILLITDRSDQSSTLAQALQRIADCQVIVTGQPWWLAGPILGIIVDASLQNARTQTCLAWLKSQLGTQRPPALFLTDNTTSAALREARSQGASACLPRYTESRAVVAALFRLIDPDATVTELIVRRGVSRASCLLEGMFHSAAAGSVNLKTVEGALDPVLSAIEEGGLTRWLDIVWEHDDATFQHCLLVAGLTAAFSQSLGLSRADQLLMARGALVHDVGKAQIPLAILNKPGKLDPGEMTVMRTHAALGYDVLVASGCSDSIALAVTRHHHEMLDGTGYPDGLSGDAVADPIRLLTICDIYAALIERRPYKAPFSSEDAMGILCGMAGKLEGKLVHAFGLAVMSRGSALCRAVG